MHEKLWTCDEAAEYLHKSPMAVRVMCSKRQIPFLKIGRVVRFQPETICRWLEGKCVEVK